MSGVQKKKHSAPGFRLQEPTAKTLRKLSTEAQENSKKPLPKGIIRH